MTTTETEKPNLILAKCRENLALAEKRTPGKWVITHREPGHSSRAPRNITGPLGSAFQPGVMRTCIAAPHRNDDADFIAACAGSAEAGWRSTIAAIEWLQSVEPDRIVDFKNHQKLINNILSTWEGLL